MSDTPTPSQTPSTGLTPSTTAAPAPSGPAACSSGSVELGSLTAVDAVDSGLLAGKPVRFTLEVRSRQGSVCAFAPVLTLVVTSGSDRIWTSADCPVTAVGGPGVTAPPDIAGTARTLLVPGGVLLGAGGTATVDLVWPGVRSTGSCTAAEGALGAGTYVASVEVTDAGSTGTAFTLR